MQAQSMSALYRRIAVLMIAVMVSGCSKAVDIPREDIDDAKYREPGSYRIRLKGWDEYLVKRFTTTDSSVVIEELLPSDERFRMGREELPQEISLSQVSSVSRMETNVPLTFAVSLVLGAVGWLIGSMIASGGWE